MNTKVLAVFHYQTLLVIIRFPENCDAFWTLAYNETLDWYAEHYGFDRETLTAKLVSCITFSQEVAQEDMRKKNRQQKAAEHDPVNCGCEYRGNDMWSCGHVDSR